ncbi:TPA: aldehyde dehydrogenase family protein, partial [Escherichia coli]
METVGNFIQGKTRLSNSGETLPVTNPATGEVIRLVTQSTRQDMLEAIQSAHEAFPAWSKMAPLRRARILFEFKVLLEKHRDELAALIVSEHGKVWSDALGELTRGIEVVEFAC